MNRLALLALVACAGGCAYVFAHDPPLADPGRTDCHDGTFCASWEICTQPLSNGNHCEASDSVATTEAAKRKSLDGGL